MGDMRARGIELQLQGSAGWSRLFPDLPAEVQRTATICAQLETELQFLRDAARLGQLPDGFTSEDLDLLQADSLNIQDLLKMLRVNRAMAEKELANAADLRSELATLRMGALSAPRPLLDGLVPFPPLPDATWANPHASVRTGVDWLELHFGDRRFVAPADRLVEKAREQVQAFSLAIGRLEAGQPGDILLGFRGVGRDRAFLWLVDGTDIIARGALRLGHDGTVPFTSEREDLSIGPAVSFLHRSGWTIVRIRLDSQRALGALGVQVNLREPDTAGSRFAGAPPRGIIASRLLRER